MFVPNDLSKRRDVPLSVLMHVSDRGKKMLKSSWAGVFRNDIMPNIDEHIFEPLYAAGPSRPNVPVNIIIGILLLKECFQLTDAQVIESTELDLRFRLALCLEGCERIPGSERTLERFRMHCVMYELRTGVDLIHKCIVDLADGIAKLMDIDGSLRRMDSFMISANIRNLGRAQLIYMCTARLVRADSRRGVPIADELKRYLEKSDYNKTFHHTKDCEVLGQILADAARLLREEDEAGQQTEEYRLLQRCMEEQTVTDEGSEIPRLREKGDPAMHSGMLQNPSDPDATFRSKNGEDHRGYVGNFEEWCGENGTVIGDYDVEPNNYSDQQFMQDWLDSIERHDKRVTMVTDAPYGSTEMQEEAAAKNIEHVVTDLTGKDPNPIDADFVFTEDHKAVTTCPGGHAPVECKYNERTGQVRMDMDRNACSSCPMKDLCGAKIYKKKAVVTCSWAGHTRAEQAMMRGTDRYRNLSRLRNGVEATVSKLRNVLRVDRLPVRGHKRTRQLIGLKVGALNFGKLLNFRRSRGNYAQNPILAAK